MKASELGLGLLAVLATGAMFAACLPLGERAALAWVALVPLLLASRGRGFIPGFLGGLGAVFFAAWLTTLGVFSKGGNASSEVGWVYTGYGIFGFSFALACGAWADRSTARLSAWWFAALATLLEAALMVQLPSHLALSQYRNAAMVQLASVGGVWMVSFSLWWVNFALARRQWLALIPALGAMLLGDAWLPAGGATRRLAAMQIEDADAAAWRAGQAAARRAGADLVVWPEFAGMTLAMSGDPTELRAVGGPAFVTSFPDDAKPLPHNTAALFSEGRMSAPYWKRKLFGGESKMHVAGIRAVSVDGIGLNVCYDSCFPYVIRETALAGAALVALPTNDPPSSYDFIAAIHAAYTPFRAAESGLAFVRADSGARSMIVDARGRIAAQADRGQAILVASVAVGPRSTPFRRLGDWFLWLCGAMVLGGLWRGFTSREPSPSPTSPHSPPDTP